MMLSMHTPSTRPWRNTILLFCSLFVFLSAPIILAEEGGEAQGSLDESPVFVPLPASGDEWNRGGWDEGGSDEEEGGDGEDEDGEEQEEEKWLETVQENLDGIEDEATRKCIEETIHAKEKRCEVSSIEGCAAKTAFKTLATEGKCGGAIFGIAEFDESGAGEDHDFQKPFEEHREGGGGCVPFHATLEGVKAEMSGRTPEEIIEEFERRKHWMSTMATNHGGN